MEIKIEKYKESDKQDLVKCMVELQDYLISIDPMKRLRRVPDYGKKYTDNLLEKINKHKGIIFLAKADNKVIGCIAGIIEKQKPENLLECVPTKASRVLEVYVDEKFRGKSAGSQLMKKFEDYCKKSGCDFIRVEVFVPNSKAHTFYQKMNYNNRIIDMLKKI